jgi:ubiquitin
MLPFDFRHRVKLKIDEGQSDEESPKLPAGLLFIDEVEQKNLGSCSSGGSSSSGRVSSGGGSSIPLRSTMSNGRSRSRSPAHKEPQAQTDVTINMLCGDQFQTKVHSLDTILEVKKKIQDTKGIPPHEQQLIFNGVILDDNREMADIETLTLVRQLHFKLKVKCCAKPGDAVCRRFTLDVKPSDTVDEVKARIEEEVGTIAFEPFAIYCLKEDCILFPLKNGSSTLLDNNIGKSSCFVVFK